MHDVVAKLDTARIELSSLTREGRDETMWTAVPRDERREKRDAQEVKGETHIVIRTR